MENSGTSANVTQTRMDQSESNTAPEQVRLAVYFCPAGQGFFPQLLPDLYSGCQNLRFGAMETAFPGAIGSL